jgi:hypothetical protein
VQINTPYRNTAQALTIMHVLVPINTSIPIPEILDWSDGASNAIGSEYIVMEYAGGVPLHQRWPQLWLVTSKSDV